MGRFLVGGWGQGADSPQKGAKLKIFFILLLSLRQLMAYNDIKNNIHGLRSYFRLLAACLPWLIYQLLVHKSQSSLFKAPPLDPASPAFFLKFLFHLPSPFVSIPPTFKIFQTVPPAPFNVSGLCNLGSDTLREPVDKIAWVSATLHGWLKVLLTF